MVFREKIEVNAPELVSYVSTFNPLFSSCETMISLAIFFLALLI